MDKKNKINLLLFLSKAFPISLFMYAWDKNNRKAYVYSFIQILIMFLTLCLGYFISEIGYKITIIIFDINNFILPDIIIQILAVLLLVCIYIIVLIAPLMVGYTFNQLTEKRIMEM
ncbi:hypothetical protein K4R29_11965 [Staphylococcus epidermidis]|nr:hypothetical protein [Staphylococcus epidermidis]